MHAARLTGNMAKCDFAHATFVYLVRLWDRVRLGHCRLRYKEVEQFLADEVLQYTQVLYDFFLH